jgi:fatty acid CoA ligase FadD9
VLLTGANGYLGRFLCLELLRQSHATGGTLICLVRGQNNASARERLDAAFDSGDPELLDTYRKLAEQHLTVVAGDVSQPHLDLSPPDWLRLAETADLIVHPAAQVNHLLPYAQLFAPNVVGTAEVIRLALTTRRKQVTYISTMAIADQTEDDDIRLISPERKLNNTYANGYSTSKWAGEVLLREAHEKYGLPVAVFRSNLIGAHSRYTGQLNTADTFTRLLFSLLATGIAPRSWQAPANDGVPQRAHLDVLPVDFTAAAIATLGTRATEAYATYHVVNPHTDGIGLDDVVDHLIATGHPIHHIDDYADWLTRFETALRALPEHQRTWSALPILDAYQQPIRPGTPPSTIRFRAAVRATHLDDIPRLTTTLIDKYVDDLKHHRLPRPSTSRPDGDR